MADQIGARLSSLDESAQVMDQTGADAVDAGQQAANVAAQMNDSVTEATEAMRAHISEQADRMRESISRAHNSLMSTEWTGSARQRAEGIEAELQGEVDRVVADAEQRAEQFKAEMLNRANAELEQIRGEFGSVMQSVQGRYEQFATEERATGQRLADADTSSFAG